MHQVWRCYCPKTGRNYAAFTTKALAVASCYESYSTTTGEKGTVEMPGGAVSFRVNGIETVVITAMDVFSSVEHL